MGVYCLLLMVILTVIIPDVIERFEPVTGIRMILLHHLISHSTHLECRDFNNSITGHVRAFTSGLVNFCFLNHSNTWVMYSSTEWNAASLPT